MVRTRRARATIHPSPANLAVATDAGQRLRKPCRNPGHLRYPRLHPACSQAARQGRARAPQSTMTKVDKSHSKGTFAGAFGNDEDAPFSAIRSFNVGHEIYTAEPLVGPRDAIIASSRFASVVIRWRYLARSTEQGVHQQFEPKRLLQTRAV